MPFEKGVFIPELEINNQKYRNIKIESAEKGYFAFLYHGFIRVFSMAKVKQIRFGDICYNY